MAAGLLLIAVGFAAVAVARPARLTRAAGLLPAAALVVLLTLGRLLIAPVTRARAPDLAGPGRLGLCTGALSSVPVAALGLLPRAGGQAAVSR